MQKYSHFSLLQSAAHAKCRSNGWTGIQHCLHLTFLFTEHNNFSVWTNE